MRKRFNHSSNITSRHYTLVEMLMVMAIIAILIGVGAGGYTVARRWLAKSTTEALLAKLKISIESYKNDKGYYPWSTNAVTNFRLDTNANDYHSGITIPTPNDHLQPRNNMSSYMDFSKLRSDQSFKIKLTKYNEYFVKDGWNSPVDGENFGAIKYRCPGLINKTSFDLYSAGNDRKFAVDPTTDIEDDIYVKF